MTKSLSNCVKVTCLYLDIISTTFLVWLQFLSPFSKSGHALDNA